jgi:uncharacterized membrane protein YsdA (DUF1294 family)
MWVPLYLVMVNTGSYYLFKYDKQRAIKNEFRISENTLLTSALLGGYFGGISSIIINKHKNRKHEFLYKYFMCIGINVAGTVGYFWHKHGFRPITTRNNWSNWTRKLNKFNKMNIGNKQKRIILNSFRKSFQLQITRMLRRLKF